MDGKKVLLLNAGITEERLIPKMKELGCYVITTGNRPWLPGHKLADKYIYCDFSNKDEILHIAETEKIDAICPCCNDMSVITASYVAEKLGLPGHDSYQAACILHNKENFKKFARNHLNINTPIGESFTDKEDAFKWAKSSPDYPVIVKPADLDSGKGVKKACCPEELYNAIDKAFQESISGHIVIEPFITGTQHGFCTFLVNKKVRVISSDNEDSFVNPYRVEVARLPASCFDQVKDQLVEQIEYMARVLDLSDGIFHLQFIYSNGRAYILECMRRIIGNLYSILSTILDEGFDWDYWYVRAVCGFECDHAPYFTEGKKCVGFRSLLSTTSGKYMGIRISDEVSQYVFEKKELLEIGEEVKRPFFDPIALLYFKFDNEDIMRTILIDKYDEISVLTSPVKP